MARAASAASACFAAARSQRRARSNAIFVLLSAAGVAIWSVNHAAFSMPAAPSRVLERERARAAARPQVADDVDRVEVDDLEDAAEDLDADEVREKKQRKNATTPLLKLGDDLKIIEGSPVTQGPQWATCFVEAQEDARISSEGVSGARRTLEEWVVRGERNRVREFQEWRARQSKDASTRCVPRSAKAAEDAFCLECISHSGVGAFPFTPLGRVTTTASGAIMTFSGLHECLASTAGAGYCKTGTVAMAE